MSSNCDIILITINFNGQIVSNPQKQTLFSKGIDGFFESAAEMARFTVNAIREGIKPPYEFREVLNQCFEIGIKSFLLVGITAFILGLVLVMQSLAHTC